MSTRKYRIVLTWHHRKWGPQMEKLAGEGSSVRRALNKSLQAFFKDKSKRHLRRDAHAGFTVTIQRLKKAQEG